MSKAERVFHNIYLNRLWNPVGTRSGTGSTVEATAEIREMLPSVVEWLGIRSVLDAACGEALWVPDLPGYIGCDIVPEAIETARSRYPDREYFVADIQTDELPKVDAVLCRDVLMHLPVEDGVVVLENLRRTGAQYLFATTFTDGTNARGIEMGEFYLINLAKPPFELREVAAVDSIPDTWKWPDKRLGVYECQF